MATTDSNLAREIVNRAWERGKMIDEIVEELSLQGIYQPNGRAYDYDAVDSLIECPGDYGRYWYDED